MNYTDGQMSWIEDVIEFRGHKSIRATHKTTFEITTDHHLTENGDCIVGVGASKGCSQLDERVRSLIMRSDPIAVSYTHLTLPTTPYV